MNKYTALTILLAVFLIAGCTGREQERYVCTSFKTPWSYSTTIQDGMIWWSLYKWSDSSGYRLKDGDVCHREKRPIKSIDSNE